MSDKNFPDVIREIHDQDNRFGKGAITSSVRLWIIH